ncbi:putative adenosine deaminase family protein [Blumeria hordei DH14]|uniref:Putative adenosine deaminase family protein n=1 Tax=Blumeria graminis f. sp. hordei (strain DH14) TaxID=546991 RepID=N1J8I1_BLUG1|nr:putative adenosine deaminase family protein [Blumeria hordei DH14]
MGKTLNHETLSQPQEGLSEDLTHGTDYRCDWKAALEVGDFDDVTEYHKARRQLELAVKSKAFDTDTILHSSKIEKEAARLLKKIIAYDKEQTYGKNKDETGQKTDRSPGGHFLGNLNLINKTELIKVAKKMPKGAHLHVHFNSCLPARFLLHLARDIDAMHIRSTLPLINSENMAQARISFMVMTKHEATHSCDHNGNEIYVPTENIWDEKYTQNRWMPYKQFRIQFNGHDCKISRNQTDLDRTIAAELWLEKKLQFSEDEAHNSRQTSHGVWEIFNSRTQMIKGLFSYESAFRHYTQACIRNFVEDNIQYAEVRPNFMRSNCLKKDNGSGFIDNEGILEIIDEELKKTMAQINKEKKYFAGMKVIYCTPRSFQRDQVAFALNDCIDLKCKYKNLICGFDLVGHEEKGNELRLFVPEFLKFRQECKKRNVDIPFLFHCGETLQVGGKFDGNLYDAILLKSKRIGHGYAIARHPVLMDIIREKNIAIESCPISNEILGLTPVISAHHLPILLANNVPCTINSDNATFYRPVTYPLNLMIGSESMSLQGWKKLAKWSLEHSCLDPEELEIVMKEWSKRWDEFCQWIIDEYGPRLSSWEPKQDH